MSWKIKITLLALFALLNLGILGCTTVYNPATGQQEFILIDTQDEIQIGRQVAHQVYQRFRVYRNPDTNEYLGQIGQRVASVSDRQDLAYHFIILDEDDINAFTVPGGYIYVFRGLLDIADTDDELAGVLAHEVGHVAARHIIKKMQAQMGYEILLSLATRGRQEYQNVVRFANVAFNLVMLGYSREDEYFADKLAVRYMKRAGFDPQAMINFLEKLKRQEKESPPAFLSTHPGLDERIEHIKQEIVSYDTSCVLQGRQ
jgi:predicted Zn-dependent protease